MPQAGGVTDFGADFARGAQVGNMQVMQQERMMQLRGQEALRIIQERHLAAQADQIAYNLAQAKAEKAKEDADLQMADEIHHTLTETVDPGDKTPEEVSAEATKATDEWLLNRNPKLALKVGQARAVLAKPELAQAGLETKEKIAQAQQAGALQRTQARVEGQQGVADTRADAARDVAETAAEARTKAAEIRGKFGVDIARTRADHLAVADEGYKKAVAAGDVELANHYLDLEHKISTSTHTQPLDQASRKEIDSIYKQIDAIKERTDSMPDETGLFSKSPNSKKAQLLKQVEDLKEEARKIVSAKGKTASVIPAPKLVVGAKYKNAKGETRIYGGLDADGKAIWKE